jgi:TetR/AcrR family transcriptional regulator, transcriptional repressor for nem operon
MLDEGYAAVTYRRIAAQAGVTSGLVQYYFPTQDELFVALLRRHADSNFEKLMARLDEGNDHPLQVIWENSSNETTAAMAVELMALANHHKSIRSEIAEVGVRSRNAQIEALSRVWRTQKLLGASPMEGRQATFGTAPSAYRASWTL